MFEDYLEFLTSIVSQNPFSITDGVVIILLYVYIKQEKYFGLKKSSVNVIVLSASLLGAVMLYRLPALFLFENQGQLGSWVIALSFLTFFSVFLAFLSFILKKVFPDQGPQGSKAVYITGALSFFILCSGIVTILLLLPVSQRLEQIFTSSVITRFTAERVLLLDMNLQKLNSSQVQQAVNFYVFSSNQEKDHPIKLSKSIRAELQDSSNTDKLIHLLQKERINKNRSPLQVDKSLNNVSRDRLEEIAAARIIDRSDRTGFSLPDRLFTTGNNFTSAGEIVVWAPYPRYALLGITQNKNASEIVFSREFTAFGAYAASLGASGNLYVITFTR